MTHSALTKSIQKLEELWGVRLFERTTRSIVTTEAGLRLAQLAPDLLAHAANVKSKVQAGDMQMNIICGAAIVENYIPNALLKFQLKRPEVSLNIGTMPPSVASEYLVNRRCELLLFHAVAIETMPNRRDFDIRLLVDEPYFMIYRSGHKIAQVENLLENVLQFDWVVAGFGTGYQSGLPKSLLSKFKSHGFPKYRVMSQAACLNMVGQSDLITLMPQSAAQEAVKTGVFAARPFPGKARLRLAAATLAKSPISENLEEFLAAIDFNTPFPCN